MNSADVNWGGSLAKGKGSKIITFTNFPSFVSSLYLWFVPATI